MRDLKEKYGTTALITGASAGIGEAFAREFAARGLNLVLTARREERLNRLAEELAKKHGVRTLAIAQDLAAPGAAEMIYNRTAQNGIQVDVLVDNAGFGVYEEFGARQMDRDLAMVDLHCRAVLDLTWRFLPEMKRRRRGAVIIISSVLAVMPAPYLATYAATKAFDLSLGESLYGEMKPYGIDVLAVMPTLTRTEFHSGAQLKRNPLLVRQAEDVVRTTLRALGKKPSVADGGLTKVLLLAMKFIPRSILVAGYCKYRKSPENTN